MQTIAQKLIEKGKKEGKIEGKLEGKMEEKQEVISKALEANLPIELISTLSGFSPDEIRQYQILMKMKPVTMN